MLRNLILALVAVTALSASAANTYTNLPANTITISANVDKKDIVCIRGDKLWMTHIQGERPTNVHINDNPWEPTWDDDDESSTFTMKFQPRFLPMRKNRGIISVSVAQTDAAVSVIEFPDESNEWILVLLVSNKADKPQQVDATISWEEDLVPVTLPNHTVPHTKPDPTPTGLR